MFSPYKEDPVFQWLVSAAHFAMSGDRRALIEDDRPFTLEVGFLGFTEGTDNSKDKSFHVKILHLKDSKFLKDHPSLKKLIKNLKGRAKLSAILSGSKALIPDLGKDDMRPTFDKIFEEARFFGSVQGGDEVSDE